MNTNSGLWASGFRPFFLVGATYGPLVLALVLGARLVGSDHSTVKNTPGRQT